MLKKLRIYILTISFATITLMLLSSCRVTRLTYMYDSEGNYCSAIKTINEIILTDNEMLDFFSNLNKDTLILYLDTTVTVGFNPLFSYDLALIRDSNDTTKNLEETYNDLMQESLLNINNKKEIIVPCNRNDFLKREADLEINYWYSSNDNLYSIDIVEILKEPGYRQGYMFLIREDNNKFEIVKRSNWTE